VPFPDPRVSVVLITHNRVEELAQILALLTELPERPRIVVVDNASVDGTAETVRQRFPAVDLLEAGDNLGAAGRNLGVSTVDTPYVAFCDDDTWWSPGSLTHAADLLDEHPRLAVVTGHILVEPDGVDDPVCADMRDSPLPRPAGLPGHPLFSFLAGASVLRRRAFTEVGGFHPRFFVGGEEELMAADLVAAGWALTYVPEIVVHHRASEARDPHLRRRHGIRNTLWFTWLRRPFRSALRRTVALVRTLPRDGITLGGLIDAVAGAPWVLRQRRVLPPHVEAGLQLLDESQLHSKARRYIS
jgi:GT2 family glycosyltransferase